MNPSRYLLPTFDRIAAYPELTQARAGLRAGDWAAVRDIYKQLDWDGRYELIRAIGTGRKLQRILTAAVSRDPSDTLAGTLLSVYTIDAGWAIRTDARAKYVSRRQFTAFHEYLRRADRLLAAVVAQEPENAAAGTLRLLTARGLQLGQGEALDRYEQVVAHEPHFLPAQSQLLQQLAPKWSGSLERMHAFARTCAFAAPEGSHNAVLIVEAHLERWLDLGDKYLRQPSVEREIRQAAELSVLHPEYRRSPGWVWVQNTFAMAFWLIGDHKAAAPHFAAVGRFASEDPWDYLPGSRGLFPLFSLWSQLRGARK